MIPSTAPTIERSANKPLDARSSSIPRSVPPMPRSALRCDDEGLYRGRGSVSDRLAICNVHSAIRIGYAMLQLSVANFGYAREIIQEEREIMPQEQTALRCLL